MSRSLAALALAVGAAGCVPQPYFTLKTTTTKYVVGSFAATSSGVKVGLTRSCEQRMVERWCTHANPQCRPEPVVVRTEPSACPAAAPDLAVSLRAPWGKLYNGRGPADGVDVPLAWTTSEIDPLADDAAALVRKAWFLQSEDRSIEVSYEPTEADASAILSVIGKAADIEYAIEGTPQGTTLVAKFANASTPNHVAVSVTNTGNAPAHRVVAKLRSGYGGADNLQLSFGRIAPHETKERGRAVAAPTTAADSSPMFVAEVTAANAPRVSVSQRLKLALAEQQTPPAIDVSCTAPADPVAPGQSARIQCELGNTGGTAASDLVYIVGAGASSTPSSGPKVLAPGQRQKLVFLAPVPGNAQAGARLSVVVTIRDRAATWRSKELTVTIAAVGLCKQQKLTRAEYQAKRKKLQAALDSGALTQAEFNQYDAEYVVCIQ